MEYEILRTYTGDDLADYYRAYHFKRKRRPSPKQASPAMQSAVSAVFLLIGLTGILFIADLAGPISGPVVRMLSGFFLGVGMLLLLGNLGAIGANKSKRERWAEENSKGHYRFSETGFASYIGDAAYACNYAAVETLLEDEGHFYLFMSHNSGHILCKSAFTQGDPEHFRTFLEEKTGMEFLHIPSSPRRGR